MKKRIKWENIIPKPLQRLQAKYFTIRERYIDIDYEYDKQPTKVDLKEQAEQEERERKEFNQFILKVIQYTILFIFLIVLFLFVLPTLLI